MENKFNSAVSGIIHSPVDFALKGKDFPVSAAYRIENAKAPEYLWVSVKNGGKYKLYPSDSLNMSKMSIEIYTGTVPASEMNGDAVFYTLSEEGTTPQAADYYVSELVDASVLPPQPPVIMTELYCRPKGRNIGAFVEVTNPSEEKTDLYDYEILMYVNKKAPDGEPSLRFPMSEEAGKDILAPGEYAALWWVGSNNIDKKGRLWDTPADFIRDFNSDFTNRFNQIAAEDARIIPIHLYEKDSATGEKKLAEVNSKVPGKPKPFYFCIVPRGRDASEKVYYAIGGTEYGSWDNPVKRSSYWRTDIREPGTGVNIAHYAMATPGFASRYQAYPAPCAGMPVIVPVSPTGKVYISDGDVDISFAAIPSENGRVVSGAAIHLRTGCEEEKKIEAYELDDGLWHAKVPASVVRTKKELEYSITVSDGTRTVSTAGEYLCVPVYDNEGPRIISLIPSEKYAFDGRDICNISAEWYDISGTDLSRSSLFIDGKDYTAAAEWAPAFLKLGACLEYGKHSLKLTLCDFLGNISEKKVRFTVSDMQTLNAYVGEVHAHTADSDGSGFPRDAYAYARDEGQVDYFATTEHSHYTDDDKYENAILAADEFDEPGKFAALYGWEMTWNHSCGYWGHLNVINARESLHNIAKNDLPALWNWMKKRPECLGMFNHPGYIWGNFDEYSGRTDERDAMMALNEIKGPAYDFEYMHMLAKGWHASPVSNEDNHKPNWTTGTNMTGVALAPALTRQNIVDAFRANRTYTTCDRTLKIFYKINGEWMGSRIKCPKKLYFDISLSTELPDGIGKLEIVAEDNIVVAAKNLNGIRSFEWKPVMNPEFDYYYLRITGLYGYSVTAPVWIEKRPVPEIINMQYAAAYGETDTACVTVSLKNKTDAIINDVRVSFILSEQSGFRLSDAEPFRTVCCGKLKKGSTLSVSALLPEISGLRRATALVSCEKNGERLRSTAFIMLNPVRITAIMPQSSDITINGRDIENPFPYLTIYNASTADFSLDNGNLFPFLEAGKQAPVDRILSTDKITVPARSSVVLWDRSSCSELTVQDFNERYGTSLTEGVNIFPTSVHFIDSNELGHRIELRIGEETLSRIHWNYTYEYDGCVHTDIERRYVYEPNMTSTMTPFEFAKPAPGIIVEQQAGNIRSVVPGTRDIKHAKNAEKKDKRAENRRTKAFFSKTEGAVAAAGAAAIGAALAATVIMLINKKDE